MSWCASETNPTLRQACEMGALLEGGSLTGPWAVGDSGQAYGPYQEHPSYGSIAVRSSGPSAWLAIRGDYLRCLTSGDNTAQGLARIVYCAERPANMYAGGNVASAYQQLSSGSPASTSTSLDVFGIPNPNIPGIGPLFPQGLTPKNPGQIIKDATGGLGQMAGAISGVAALIAKAFDFFLSPDSWISILLVIGGLFTALYGTQLLVGTPLRKAVGG